MRQGASRRGTTPSFKGGTTEWHVAACRQPHLPLRLATPLTRYELELPCRASSRGGVRFHGNVDRPDACFGSLEAAPKCCVSKRTIRTTGYRSDGFSGFVNPGRFPVDQSDCRHTFSEKRISENFRAIVCDYSQSGAESARNRMAMWSDGCAPGKTDCS